MGKIIVYLFIQGCFQSFTTEGWLLRHRSRQHGDLPSQNSGPRIYPCSQCGKEFGKMSKLTQHMKTHRYLTEKQQIYCIFLINAYFLVLKLTTNIHVTFVEKSSPVLNM